MHVVRGAVGLSLGVPILLGKIRENMGTCWIKAPIFCTMLSQVLMDKIMLGPEGKQSVKTSLHKFYPIIIKQLFKCENKGL